MWKVLGFFVLFTLILTCPQPAMQLASGGLTLWFERMVPALFPFMILSGILIRQNLSARFACFFYPVLGKVYRISRNGVYCLIMGFLCGFPMGARCVGELYERGGLSRGEASLLLVFCNNFGPVYFVSYLLPVTGLAGNGHFFLYLFGMYGIPLLYGLFLSRTLYGAAPGEKRELSDPAEDANAESLFDSLEGAMQAAIFGITTLGGYMILFNLFNILPNVLLKLIRTPFAPVLSGIAGCLLEITGGSRLLGASLPLTVLCLSHFGGLSCIAQTKSMIKHTDLSLKSYLFHKATQTALCALYYFFLSVFFL